MIDKSPLDPLRTDSGFAVGCGAPREHSQGQESPLGAQFVYQQDNAGRPLPELPSICLGAVGGGMMGMPPPRLPPRAPQPSFSGVNIVQPPGGRSQISFA